jgi:hypothetical protein
MLALLLLQWGCKKKEVYPSKQFPAILSLSPASATMGTSIIIKGNNLKNVTDVKFGSREAANFNASSNTDTAIKVTVPDSLALGTVPVQVYYSNGGGYASVNFTVLQIPPVPKIDSVSPVNAYPGNTVTISGKNFALVTNVTFSGVVAKFAHALDTNGKLTAVVPANAKGGKQFIKVINPNGSDSVSFTVNLGPIITGFTPNRGQTGDSIVITGIRLTGATSVQLNTQATGFTVWNDSTIKFAVPAGAQNGNVTVVTPLGTAVSPASFVVVVPISLFLYKDAFLTGWSITSYSATTSETGTNAEGGGGSCLTTAFSIGYGAFRINSGTPISLAGYTTLRFSIYGGPGTSGNKISIAINNVYATTVVVQMSEGGYTDYFVPLSSLGNPTTLNELVLQEYSGKTPTIYVDNIGLN